MNVYIAIGSLQGRGVYAKKNLRKGQVVIKYHLLPITKKEFEQLPEDEQEFTHSQNGQMHLYGIPERYVNHSTEPNTYQDFEISADVTLRDIKKGEMITTDATKDDVK